MKCVLHTLLLNEVQRSQMNFIQCDTILCDAVQCGAMHPHSSDEVHEASAGMTDVTSLSSEVQILENECLSTCKFQGSSIEPQRTLTRIVSWQSTLVQTHLTELLNRSASMSPLSLGQFTAH